MEFNYGHLLDVGPTGNLNRYRFQNFAIPAQGADGESFPNVIRDGNSYDYLPFGFGGAVATLTGDRLDATLQFGNTRIARDFIVEALDNAYVCRDTTVLWNASTYAIENSLSEYFGATAAGGWDETKLQVKLNSVLDAVETNVPGRRLRRQQVGNIPFTANVRV